MGLNIVPGRYAFYLFKHFAEIKCAFKAQTVSNLIDFIILFQKKNLGPAYFFWVMYSVNPMLQLFLKRALK